MCDNTKLLTAEAVIQEFTKDLKEQIVGLLSKDNVKVTANSDEYKEITK